MRRILLVAPLASQATAGRLAALGGAGCELHVADISTRPLRCSAERYPFTLIRGVHDLAVKQTDPMYAAPPNYGVRAVDLLRSLKAWPESRRITRRLGEVVESVRPDVLVVYYGPSAMHFARIARRLYPGLPIVLIHNVLPTFIERRGALSKPVQNAVNNELVDYRRWLGTLDFYVHASEEMAEFAMRSFGIPASRIAVLPDYFPRGMQAQPGAAEAGQINGAPRVIFLGAPERWGHAIDDVDAQFLAIAEQGISVHAGQMSENVIATGLGARYRYFTDDEVFCGGLTSFAHGFDAALITYAPTWRMERFRSTLPTRFFTALAAALPIAVKAGIFDAVESYVRRHGLGFAYSDARDLRAKLADREKMAEYRANAIEHLKTAAAEEQSPHFEAIFDRLCAARGTRTANG